MSARGSYWAAKQQPGSANKKLILIALGCFADKASGITHARQGRIMEFSGLSERTVRSCLKELEDDGYISRQQRHARDGARLSDRITLNLSRQDAYDPDAIEAEGRGADSRGEGHEVPGGGAPDAGLYTTQPIRHEHNRRDLSPTAQGAGRATAPPAQGHPQASAERTTRPHPTRPDHLLVTDRRGREVTKHKSEHWLFTVLLSDWRDLFRPGTSLEKCKGDFIAIQRKTQNWNDTKKVIIDTMNAGPSGDPLEYAMALLRPRMPNSDAGYSTPAGVSGPNGGRARGII